MSDPSHFEVVCEYNKGYEASLSIGKTYCAIPDPPAEQAGMWRVIDESGEYYLYPKNIFSRVVGEVVEKKTLDIECICGRRLSQHGFVGAKCAMFVAVEGERPAPAHASPPMAEAKRCLWGNCRRTTAHGSGHCSFHAVELALEEIEEQVRKAVKQLVALIREDDGRRCSGCGTETRLCHCGKCGTCCDPNDHQKNQPLNFQSSQTE